VAFARALLESDEGSDTRRKADADIRTEDLLRARLHAAAIADAAKESTRSMRDQLNAVQSVGAMLRAQMSLGG
jgi:hypothetical protein